MTVLTNDLQPSLTALLATTEVAQNSQSDPFLNPSYSMRVINVGRVCPTWMVYVSEEVGAVGETCSQKGSAFEAEKMHSAKRRCRSSDEEAEATDQPWNARRVGSRGVPVRQAVLAALALLQRDAGCRI